MREAVESQYIAIIDSDDTLTDSMHRENLLPDWPAFHDAGKHDKVFKDMSAVLDCLNGGGWHVIVITGCNEMFRTMKMKYYNDNDLFVDELHMRPNDNFQPSQVFKVGVIKSLFGENLEKLKGKEVIFIDDSEKNCEAVRALGITTLHITPGRRQS